MKLQVAKVGYGGDLEFWDVERSTGFSVPSDLWPTLVVMSNTIINSGIHDRLTLERG